MPAQKITREEIIEKSIRTFNEQGYYATSMNDLASVCGLFKGSFYHYFSSKEDLMREALKYAHQRFKETTLSIAYNETLSPKERLQQMLTKQTKAVSRGNQGCFFGNTILETANKNGEFREILQEVFRDWTHALTHLYQEKYGREAAGEMAQQTIMEIEGAVMLMKMFGSTQLLEKCTQRIIARL